MECVGIFWHFEKKRLECAHVCKVWHPKGHQKHLQFISCRYGGYRRCVSGQVQKGLCLSRILRLVHGARQATENAIKTAHGGRLSFSRALTRYENRVQSVLCHSKGAGRVAKGFRKSGPERIFKTELLAIPCVPSFVAVCIFRHSRLGARSAVPGWMRVPPFPVRCVFRHSRLDACSS